MATIAPGTPLLRLRTDPTCSTQGRPLAAAPTATSRTAARRLPRDRRRPRRHQNRALDEPAGRAVLL